MNENEVKKEIRERILEINETFPNRMVTFYSENLKEGDIKSLEKILKRVSRSFMFSKIISIVLIVFLWIISFITYFKMSESHIDMNKAGLLIICSLPLIINTYHFYKVKVNLENKIYLMRLLERINEA